jgi:hypothetical protein
MNVTADIIKPCQKNSLEIEKLPGIRRKREKKGEEGRRLEQKAKINSLA